MYTRVMYTGVCVYKSRCIGVCMYRYVYKSICTGVCVQVCVCIQVLCIQVCVCTGVMCIQMYIFVCTVIESPGDLKFDQDNWVC